MENNIVRNDTTSRVGIPYKDINWYDLKGQPFGIANQFNVIVFNDANNIVDTRGAMAVGGNFYSPRGLSLAFGDDAKAVNQRYSPDSARFLVGGTLSVGGPLVVVGHVVGGGSFRVAKGSTYLIGKDGSMNQARELAYLYQANGGSAYWTPTDKIDHYLISSYDVPRYIPAPRIGANLSAFFRNAMNSIVEYKKCIQGLPVNGSVIDNKHEWILRGNNPQQNVFLIDVRPNGLLNKGIRAEVPVGSLVIVKIRTGNNAHLQYGLYGEKYRANHTLYVFEDATSIFMEKSSDIWGSILAPQAMFHAHQTGGHVSGNAALRAFAVSPTSGFEFHSYPFVGGVICGVTPPAIPKVPLERPIPEILPMPVCPACPPAPPCPEVRPCPQPPPCPEARPCPQPPPCPEARPCPQPPPCPEARPCPQPPPCPVCPEVRPCPQPPPCPVCPEVRPCPQPPPCPEARPCPQPPPCPVCPEVRPCPKCPPAKPCPQPPPCPVCPEVRPCPKCPPAKPCPQPPPCPVCPEQTKEVKYVPYLVEVPYLYCPKPKSSPEDLECKKSLKCPITPGNIMGCVWGCDCCCDSHKWEVKLYQYCDCKKTLLHCEKIDYYGCFKFEVPFEGCYLLLVCAIKPCNMKQTCKPCLTLKNVGVSSLMIEC